MTVTRASDRVMSEQRRQFIEAIYERAQAMGLDPDETRDFVMESIEAAEARGDL